MKVNLLSSSIPKSCRNSNFLFLASAFKNKNLFLVLMLFIGSISFTNAQLDCSGNVPIDNLANGMDYSIVSDGAGNIDITVTVVDNPPGLVGFLGGPGNPISFPDATGTFMYNLTGETEPYTLDIFFNWAAGGAGSSETVICEADSDCTAAAAACATCPEAQVSIPMTAGESFNDAGRFDGGGDPIFPNWDPVANTGTLTIEAGSNSTFVVSGVNNIAIPDDATDLCFTADLEAISGDYPFLLEFRIEQKDPVSGAEVGRLTFDQNIDGTGVCSIGGNLADGTPSGTWAFDPANFDYALVWAIADFDGTAPTEDLVIEVSNVTLLACVGATCTLAAADCATCAGDQMSIPMTDGTAFNDAGRFDGGGAPIFPDYDPVTNMGTLTIEAGSNSTFVVSGVDGIMIPDGANDLCFTADLNVLSGDYPFVMEFRIEMKDPATGNEIERLTLNQSIDGPGACSIGGNVSDGAASAGFVVDPANFDYALVWALADFDGTPPAEDLIVEVSNVTLLACVPSDCTIEAAACTACTECDATVEVEFPNLLNLSNSAVQPNFTSTGATMGGTLTLPAGATDVFTVAAGQRLVIPNSGEITDICAFAEVDVISGSFPFLLEFRVFNASTGAQLNFNQMVDGAGMCSIGGSLSDAIDASGFTWDNSCLEFVVATAFFPGDGSTLGTDRIIDISNMSLSICTAESEQPEITCPSQGPNLFANPGFDTGDLSGWSLFGNGGVEGNVGDPIPSAFLFSFTGGFGASGLFQSFPVNEEEFYCIGADFMALACDGGNSQIFGTDDFFELNIRYLDADGIALNGPAFCGGAPFGPLCGTGFQTQMTGLTSNDLDSWLKAYGCFQAPEGAVSVEAVIAINDGGTPDGGAVLVDNATFNQVIPQVFAANTDECIASVVIVDPVPTDNCAIATFTNDFNGTDMASGDYPVGQTLVTYTATDEAGNVACCSIVIEVEDNQGPQLLDCAGSVQSADGNCEFFGSGGGFTIADNCPDNVTLDEEYIDEDGNVFLDLTFELAPGGYGLGDRVYPLGVNTVNLTVTDENGNTSTCTFTVEVIDDTDPVAMCQDVTLSLDENGEATITDGDGFLIDNGSGDNCATDDAMVTLEVSQADFSCDDLVEGQVSTDLVVTLTVTDAAGNISMCDATVTLMDDTAPAITCPANINIALDAGDCDRVIDYNVLASDNCGLVADAEGNTVIQTAGLPSGEVFPIGTTTNSFEVTDATGNVSSCSFDVVVVENPDPVTALSCNGNLNISLDENCEAFIGADQILEGGGYGCYDDYIVEIEGINGQTIFAPGTYTITIIDPDTGNSCWSEVTVEDKLEPTLVCTECPPGATSMIELPFTGTLDADSPIWTRPFGQPATCAPSGAGVDVPYSTHEFLVVTGADSDFENVSFTAPSADFFMVLYQDSFDPLNPCGNMVINNDDGGGGLLSQFDVMLESGVQYILVATTFNNNGNDFGDYIIELDSEAILIDAPAECLFKCFDETAILAGVMPVPSPVAMDNCVANLPTFYTDVVTEGAICGSKVITRTFSITGADGNVITSCVAEYQLFAAQFSDFTPPPPVVELPCGTGTSPEEIEAFFDDPTTNDITNPNCPLDIIENNEGTTFGYLTYATLGCDGNTHLQKVDNNQCGFFTTYSDQVIPSCGAACGSENVKVIRTWTILDWCNPDDAPFTYIQVIKSEDTEAPTIEVANDFTVGVNPWNCLGDFSLPAPTLLHDLCSSEITYTVSGPVGTTLLAPNTTNNPSDYWVVFGAPKGTASFTYTAADCCGNTSSAELLVNIFDTTPPVPVATENIIINLTTSGQLDENGNALGFAKLFTNSVDDGSYDGCSGVKIEIARESDACDESGNTTFNADGHPDDGSPNPNASNYDPDGGEFVKFCCADIDQVDPVTGVAFGLVEVRMRVFDDGNMTGFYGDFVDNNGDGDVLDAGEYDNFNETWVTVRVEGKAISSIVCPPDVTLACDMDYTDPAMIGSATTLALCGSESVDVSFTPQLNACGIGFVIATYTVAGSSPSISCSQRITIENPYPAFDPDGIRFPRDLPTSPTGQIACDDDITYDAPTWTAGACDFIGYTEEVDTFFFEVDPETGVPSDACFKILRRFTVIDWCVYDETNGADGLYDGNQTIKITDREAPVLLDCAPQMFEVDANCVRESTILTNMAEDNGDCASDWLKWQVFVDTWADGVVDYEYSSFLPTNDSNINNDTNGNGINDRYLAPTSSGEEVEITVAEVIESSMFNHLVTWKVTDGCGNVASCTTTFMVVDKKAPTPYCVSLSTALMQNSQPVELWAIDFDLGAFDNCTDQDDLRFTFSSTPPEDDNSYDSALRSSAQSFGTAGVIPVNVYVWDEKGNADFCTVSLTVIDNGGTGLRVAGITATELGNGVSEADVIIEANLDEYPRTVATDESGAYAFESNPSNIDYEVTVNKNDNHTNGVSTLDLVLIQRHIVGFGDLDSPYKVIAADINSDEKVSSIDVVELRKLILGVQDEFEYNTSWRFVDVAQEFADIQSPWPIDENRSISDLTTDLEAENFVAVKIGDVNATATHNVVGVSTEVRSATTMVLEVADRAVVAGEQVEIAVSSSDFNAVSGLQMTIEFNGLSFNDVAGKAISVGASNVGVLSENIITMSWNSNTSISTTEDLFVITAMATKDGFISEMINVTDRVIRPEVYVGSNLEIQNVQLGIRGGSVITAVSELMQNEPNPFKASTLISFNLATAGKATLTVRDVAGKVIRTVNGEYAAGLNTITLEKSDLNTVGVLYYTLESGEFNQTMKMIVVE